MAVNPVTAGILTGASSGAVAGMAGGPWGIAVGAVVGATIGAFQGSEQQKATGLALDNAQAERENSTNNENALVQQNFLNKQKARGLTDSVKGTNSGSAAGLTDTLGASSEGAQISLV